MAVALGTKSAATTAAAADDEDGGEGGGEGDIPDFHRVEEDHHSSRITLSRQLWSHLRILSVRRKVTGLVSGSSGRSDDLAAKVVSIMLVGHFGNRGIYLQEYVVLGLVGWSGILDGVGWTRPGPTPDFRDYRYEGDMKFTQCAPFGQYPNIPSPPSKEWPIILIPVHLKLML
ncbi:hypothetical protein B0H16DRAFT_1690574 [Mycena metata]|uniref:Uncharacterized protein n=1 Tax=Mycena metata TaxID=1033252 RepID=A0AAD7J111_9AGAR|nr:hypothetical protein B0H16DRAFT_1690574 [Mycena metata]